MDGFLSEQVGQRASRRAAGSTKGQEGGRKRQPARCSRRTQDKFAIASMARKRLHRCTGAHARVVEIYIYMCAYVYIYMHMHTCVYTSPQLVMHACATVQQLPCHGSYCELILSLARTSCRLSFPPLRRAGRPPAGPLTDLFAKKWLGAPCAENLRSPSLPTPCLS